MLSKILWDLQISEQYFWGNILQIDRLDQKWPLIPFRSFSGNFSNFEETCVCKLPWHTHWNIYWGEYSSWNLLQTLEGVDDWDGQSPPTARSIQFDNLVKCEVPVKSNIEFVANMGIWSNIKRCWTWKCGHINVKFWWSDKLWSNINLT